VQLEMADLKLESENDADNDIQLSLARNHQLSSRNTEESFIGMVTKYYSESSLLVKR
jgi:hypothetical protein